MKPEKLNFTRKHSDIEQRQVGWINWSLGSYGANGNKMQIKIYISQGRAMWRMGHLIEIRLKHSSNLRIRKLIWIITRKLAQTRLYQIIF
jgi:hypothetical protein